MCADGPPEIVAVTLSRLPLAVGGFLLLTVWGTPPWIVVVLLASSATVLATTRYSKLTRSTGYSERPQRPFSFR